MSSEQPAHDTTVHDFMSRAFPPIHNTPYPSISPSRLDLSGSRVLITGGSKGIGRATVLSYAAAGASVIAIAARSDLSSLVHDVKSAAKDAGRSEPKVITLNMDVTDKDSVEQAAEQLKAQTDWLDIVINNAAVLEELKPLLEADPDTWWNTWETNVKGSYLVLRYFVPILLSPKAPAHSSKTIIALSSIGAHLVTPGLSAYQSTKHAMLRVMDFVQKEYEDQGLLAYSVHPGSVPTQMADTIAKKMGGNDFLKKMFVDEPELAADTMVWLTSQRREWLAGRFISCTWDMDALEQAKDRIIERDMLKVKMTM